MPLWKSRLLLRTVGDVVILWVRTGITVSVTQSNRQHKQKICFNLSLGYFLFDTSHVVSLVFVNYILCIWPIFSLFLKNQTKIVFVLMETFIFPPSSFRIILNLFAQEISQVWSIIWKLSFPRIGIRIWTNLQESGPLLSILPLTPCVVMDKSCNFYKL